MAKVVAFPFPMNNGSPAAIREFSLTLTEIGHKVHAVAYPDGDDLSVGEALLHLVARSRNFRGPRLPHANAVSFCHFGIEAKFQLKLHDRF